jgi:predicted DNA-binding protein (MmcQ/YjbR family)
MSFKCTPEEFAELVEREGIVPAPYMARNNWVMVENLDALPTAELKRRIKDSYQVAAKLPKKVRDKLGLG